MDQNSATSLPPGVGSDNLVGDRLLALAMALLTAGEGGIPLTPALPPRLLLLPESFAANTVDTEPLIFPPLVVFAATCAIL